MLHTVNDIPAVCVRHEYSQSVKQENKYDALLTAAKRKISELSDTDDQSNTHT